MHTVTEEQGAVKLLTKAIKVRLIQNHKINQACILKDGNTVDFNPVVKLFDPYGSGKWLITELDPDTNIMFGLCDLGTGFPALGYVSLNELSAQKKYGSTRIERDGWFEAEKTINNYANEARLAQRIDP